MMKWVLSFFLLALLCSCQTSQRASGTRWVKKRKAKPTASSFRQHRRLYKSVAQQVAVDSLQFSEAVRDNADKPVAETLISVNGKQAFGSDQHELHTQGLPPIKRLQARDKMSIRNAVDDGIEKSVKMMEHTLFAGRLDGKVTKGEQEGLMNSNRQSRASKRGQNRRKSRASWSWTAYYAFMISYIGISMGVLIYILSLPADSYVALFIAFVILMWLLFTLLTGLILLVIANVSEGKSEDELVRATRESGAILALGVLAVVLLGIILI